MIEEGKKLQVLRTLALWGAMDSFIEVSSCKLVKLLSISQPTASRMLAKLEGKGYIKREMRSRSQYVLLTEEGKDAIKKEYISYQQIFEKSSKLEIRGKVATGSGEGRYYISQYKRKFEETCKFSPYLGTLNIEVSGRELNNLELLKNTKSLVINKFKRRGRSFGSVRCFKAKIKDLPCWAILPTLTRYENILEIVSPYYLRNKLRLSDGKEIKVLIEID
jgi:riboflavin kinase